MEKPVSKEILFEYFSGRATSLQKRMVEQWLLQPENEYYFFQCLDEWERTYPQFLPDTEKALAEYEHFMDHPFDKPTVNGSVSVRSTSSLQRPLARWLSVAVISMVLLATGLLAGNEYWFYQTYSTGAGETRTLTLEDNSRVTLNANSTLRVPRNWFSGSDRKVWLTGEAFFNVRKDRKKRRFIVRTSTLEVEVLGTKFNVINRRQKTKVVLQEGKVKIVSSAIAQDQLVLMQPGDYLEHKLGANRVTRRVVEPANYTAWRHNQLIFDRTPLQDVLERVEDTYGVRIELKDSSLARQLYTGNLPANDLDIILKSLTRIYALEATRDQHYIILR